MNPNYQISGNLRETSSIPFNLISHLENYPHILERIFSYLKSKELRTIACVCQSWYRILNRLTPKANRRRSESIRKLRRLKKIKGQENWPIDMKCVRVKRKLAVKRKALVCIQKLSTKNLDQCSSFHEQEVFNDENDQNFQNLSEQPKSTKRKRWILAQAPSKPW